MAFVDADHALIGELTGRRLEIELDPPPVLLLTAGQDLKSPISFSCRALARNSHLRQFHTDRWKMLFHRGAW